MVEIISVHIGKTAGTAFRHILADVYGENQVFEAYDPSDKQLTLSDRESMADIKAIHGHFRASIYQQVFPDAKWIVWLRHPIFRLISHYFYQKSRKHRNQEVDENLDLLEFANLPNTQNLQSSYIDGMDLNDFYFIGIQEFFQEDLADLKQLMEWSEFKVNSRNQNPHPEYTKHLAEILNDTKLLNQLLLLNRKDMKLYQSALNIRAKRRQESKWLQLTLADWKRSQLLVEDADQKLRQAEKELERMRRRLEQFQTPEEAIEVVKVSSSMIDECILGFGFYSPEAQEKVTSNSLQVRRGWVLGKKYRAVEVIITSNDSILAQIPVNQIRPKIAQLYPNHPNANYSGFETTLEMTGISPKSCLKVHVTLEDNSKILIGTINSTPNS